MLKVKISSCKDSERAIQAKEFYRIYKKLKKQNVELVESYDNADVILVTDLHHKNIYSDVLGNPQHVFHYRKIICFYEMGGSPDSVPGIYTDASIDIPGTRGAPYYFWLKTHDLPPFENIEKDVRPYLFSFMGRNCNKLRAKILNLSLFNISLVDHYLEDTTYSYPDFGSVKSMAVNKKNQRDKYYNVLKQSKFVLAPKGAGLSSIRQYEAMAYGCVPVVISDKLKQPFAVNWNKCAVQVKENEIERIPQILGDLEGDFLSMSEAAREAYFDLFDPLNYWKYIEDAIIDIYKNDLDKRSPIINLKFQIFKRTIRRTIYRRKQDMKRAIANIRF
ncbi:MAG: exostosin family protein [Desulfobacteraceae bacterium]|jgi:hypothetical protein|nr:exostosin family protein [Desulfobacteraceae bacterium]